MLCPNCNSEMRVDCDVNIETGGLDVYYICYSCGLQSLVPADRNEEE